MWFALLLSPEEPITAVLKTNMLYVPQKTWKTKTEGRFFFLFRNQNDDIDSVEISKDLEQTPILTLGWDGDNLRRIQEIMHDIAEEVPSSDFRIDLKPSGDIIVLQRTETYKEINDYEQCDL
jgi:hypothetical protein